jgi:hypothetical protein
VANSRDTSSSAISRRRRRCAHRPARVRPRAPVGPAPLCARRDDGAVPQVLVSVPVAVRIWRRRPRYEEARIEAALGDSGRVLVARRVRNRSCGSWSRHRPSSRRRPPSRLRRAVEISSLRSTLHLIDGVVRRNCSMWNRRGHPSSERSTGASAADLLSTLDDDARLSRH